LPGTAAATTSDPLSRTKRKSRLEGGFSIFSRRALTGRRPLTAQNDGLIFQAATLTFDTSLKLEVVRIIEEPGLPLGDSVARSDASFTFNNQYACFAARMRDVLTSHVREKHVSNRQGHDVLNAQLAVVHIDRAVENCEYLFAVVDMPLVRLVGPVKSGRSSTHVSDVVSTPSTRCGEILASNNSHRLYLSNTN
jgi:hypothetical protein